MSTVIRISSADGVIASLTINDDGSRVMHGRDGELSGLAAEILAQANTPRPERRRAQCCAHEPPARDGHIII